MDDVPIAEVIGDPKDERRRIPWWVWTLGILCVLVIVPSCLLIVSLMYIGLVSPDTSVYSGNSVPQRFVSTMEDVGALDADEEVLYFYSDALLNIRDGFYFVSDRRVVIYSELMEGNPLVVFEFAEIDDVLLDRDESFYDDSIITIFGSDGEFIEFPVSSEYNRDEEFFEAISSRLQPYDEKVEDESSLVDDGV